VVDFCKPAEALIEKDIIEHVPSSDPQWRPGMPATRRMEEYAERIQQKRWPLVKFSNGETKLMSPFKFKHENVMEIEEASRWQVYTSNCAASVPVDPGIDVV
jgi:hypothetical protein